jgi:MoaA/NifB/PqqE/SkfB family radical SAM enzyme
MITKDENGNWEIVSREITVENTTFCGAKCVMCPRDEYEQVRKWTHMPAPLFKSIIDQSVDLGVVSLDLCGFGDPFLDPDFGDKLGYVKSHYPDVKIYTSTTAHVVQKKNLELVCKYFDTIRISHYGFSKESYEAVHGGGLKYEKVVENILKLLSVPRGERPYTMVSFLILEENEHEVDAWRDYWEGLADEIAIWRPHNYGGAGSVDPLSFKTQDRTVAETPRSCGRPFKGNPFIRTDGSVSVCCFDFNQKLVVGNLNQVPLVDVLAGESLNNVKGVHDNLSFHGSGLLCDGCDQAYDRSDALVYSSNPGRSVDQPTSHPDHMVSLVD